MSSMLTNAHRFDWADWFQGIMRSIVGGGSSGVLSGLLATGIAPEKFNFVPGAGLHATLVMMALTFLGNGLIGMMIFLKTHNGPDAENNSDTSTPKSE